MSPVHTIQGQNAVMDRVDRFARQLSQRMEREYPWKDVSLHTLYNHIGLVLLPDLPSGCYFNVSAAFDRPSDSARIWLSVEWAKRLIDSQGLHKVEKPFPGFSYKTYASLIAVAVHPSWHKLFPGFIDIGAPEGGQLSDRQFAHRMRSRRRV